MKKLILSALIIGTVSLRAEECFQASLTPDIAIHSKITQINGLALSIWGENPQSAIALGLVNGSTGDSSGLSWSLVNYADSYTGIAWGVVNISRTSFVGWQDGTVNFAEGHFLGLQMGALNVTEEMNGLQIGVVNYAEHLHGVQLGFLNVAMNNPWFNEMPDKLATGFPFLNWSF
ncbi:MAG: hypothetical protein RL616_2095 [Verrucomicrobiota bacterium]